MRNKTGKLFQNIQTRKVSAYEYIKKNEYYAFVEMIQKQGNNQCIFTSDIMLKFMEHFYMSIMQKSQRLTLWLRMSHYRKRFLRYLIKWINNQLFGID